MSFIETSTPEQLLEMSKAFIENRRAIRQHQQDLTMGRERTDNEREKAAAPIVKGITGAKETVDPVTGAPVPATGLEKVTKDLKESNTETVNHIDRLTNAIESAARVMIAPKPEPAPEPTSKKPKRGFHWTPAREFVAVEKLTPEIIAAGKFKPTKAVIKSAFRTLAQAFPHVQLTPLKTTGKNVTSERLAHQIVALAQTLLTGGAPAPTEEAAVVDPDPPGVAGDDVPKVEEGDEVPPIRGMGIPKHRSRLAYTVDSATGRLGRLVIDMGRLLAVGKRPKVVAVDAQTRKPVFTAPADEGLIKLLMNRFDSQYPYSPAAIAAFRALVRHAHLPPAIHSTKFKKFLQADPAHEQKAKAPTGGRVRYYRDPEALLDRARLLIGEIEAGNDAPEIAEELATASNALLEAGVITQDQFRAVSRKYLS